MPDVQAFLSWKRQAKEMNEVRIKATNKTHKQSQHFLRSQTIDLTKKKPNLHCARYAGTLYFDYQSDVGLLKMLKVREQFSQGTGLERFKRL